MQAGGQHMQQEAAHELGAGQRHDLATHAAAGAVVLPAEGHAARVHAEQSAVGDRHPVRVARQVGQHGRGAGERALGVDHPFGAAQGREPVGEGAGFSQRRELAEEAQSPALVQALEFFEEAPPKQAREHAHGQEESGSAGAPGTVGCQAAAGHDAVHMGVMRQRRAPGVQHERGADPSTEVLGVGGNGQQHFGGDVEQQGIHGGLVLVCDLGDGRGQREDDVVVIDREQIGLACRPSHCSSTVSQNRRS